MTLLIVGLVCFGGFGLFLITSLWKFALQLRSFEVKSNELEALKEKNTLLEKRLAKVEQVQKERLSQPEIDFRQKLQKQYADLFKQVESKGKEDFDKALKAEYEKACEQIKFDEIEYKKTITKKRKDFSRKNSQNAKPQREWRYIDEE